MTSGIICQSCQTKLFPTINFILLTLLLRLNMSINQKHSLDATATRLVPSNNFSDNFYKQLSSFNGNIISSPHSLYTLLLSLSQGTNGVTLQEFEDVLYLRDVPCLEEKVQASTILLKDTKNVELYSTNALYVQEDFPLLEEFLTTNKNIFHLISAVKFGNAQETADLINGWVRNATKNKITDIVSSGDFDEHTKLILVNAIYFKGFWLHRFDEKLTAKKNFYVSKSETKSILTMYRKGKYVHGQLESVKARFVEIPYTNPDLAMIIILPDESTDLQTVEKNIHWNDFTKVRRIENEIELYVPRFRIMSTLNLKEPLQKIGLNSMFESNADFSRMSDLPVCVDKVLQKVFIEINEKGSEAAAATAAQIRLRRSVNLPLSFEVNRPFMFAIWHAKGDIPLFLGSIRDIESYTESGELKRDEL